MHLLHRSGFCAPAALQRLLRSGKLFRSDFRFAPSLPQRSRPATSSRWLSATVPPSSSPWHSRPATNLIRRRRSSVWLAIWRIWAGFANSQHRDAAFATPNNICAHSSLLLHWAAAQTDANLSTHLHRWPTPPPYLRQMRLSPGRGRRCLVLDMAATSPGASFLQITALASKMQMPHNQIINFHGCARWHQFELTEHGAQS